MLVGVAVHALLGLFLLLSGLLVWRKVYALFTADAELDAYLPVSVAGLVFLLASGLVYQMGTTIVDMVLKSAGG